MKLNKIIVTAFAAFCIAAGAFAVNVNEDELKSAGSDGSIVFTNYTGPHARIDSAANIRGIGAKLGAVIAVSPEKTATAGSQARYAVIHVVDADDKNGLDADILSFGRRAGVDHIDNVRRIIAAYLSAAYGYSDADAHTIAVFVTVYNAVYRGKIDSYRARYKKAVMAHLQSENCGLSVNYADWAGKTQIVIPLYDVKDGGLSTVDTSVISAGDVVKRMQEDDGKGIDERKNMVDLKERESDAAFDKAETAQRNAAQEQKKLDDERKKTEQMKKDAELAERNAQAAREKAAESPDDKQAQKDAEAAERNAAQKGEMLASQEEIQKAQEDAARKAQQEAAEKQALSDKKLSEAQDERKTIAQDQQAMMTEQAAADTFAYGMALVDEAAMLSRIVKINTKTGSVSKPSSSVYIRNRTMFAAGRNFIAAAGAKTGSVKLVLLSQDTLEVVKQSAETLAENSMLIQDGGDFYCVIQDGKKQSLAKYGADLSLKTKSPVPVKGATPITAAGQYLIVTGADGGLHLLNKATLEE
ncbi:MAG: P83/100 family protein [Treponema sp.]